MKKKFDARGSARATLCEMHPIDSPSLQDKLLEEEIRNSRKQALVYSSRICS